MRRTCRYFSSRLSCGPRCAANQKSKNTKRIGSMRALHRWSAVTFRNLALGALNQNLESTAIHGWCLRRTVFLTVCLLLRPRQRLCRTARAQQRGQRPAEPRAPLDGEPRLTDPSTRIDLGGICSCRIVGSVPAHTLEVVDSRNLNDAYTLSPGGYFILP